MTSLHQQKNTLGERTTLLAIALLFLFSFFGMVRVGFAQDADPTAVDYTRGNTQGVDTSNVDLGAIADQNDTQTYDERQAENDALNQQWQEEVRREAEAKNQAATAKDKKKEDGGFWSQVGQYIGNLILTMASAFTWVGGTLLDAALQKFVFGMGDMVNTQSFGLAIDNAWKLVRDFANLAFIFGFIYLGIRAIIDPDSHFIKQTLSRIIIGALLINFSLFIVKFVVDFGNYTSYQIYTSMTDGGGTISAAVADRLGITTIFKAPDPNTFNNVTKAGMVWFYVLGALVLFIAAFVFFAAAVLLVIRFVILILIMVASPILFAATIFPKTASMASSLWGKLLAQAFFAPIYLFLTLISLTLIGGLNLIGSGGSFMKAMTNGEQADSYYMFLNFSVIIFFLIQSLLVAKKLGVEGAGMMIGAGDNLRKGATGWMGRNTIGRAGQWVADKQDSLRKSNTRGAQIGALAMRATGINAVATKAAKSNYGGSKTFKDKKDETKEIKRARAQSAQVSNIGANIAAGHSAPTGSQQRIDMERSITNASNEQLLKLLEKHKEGTPEYNALVENMSSSQFESLMKAKSEDLDDEKKAKLRSARSIHVQNKHGVSGGAGGNAGNISKADASDLDAMDFNTLVQHAGHLTSKQIHDMKNLTPSEKSVLKNARNTSLITEFAPAGVSTPASATRLFGRIRNDSERANLPVQILTDVKAAQHLNANVLTKILDNDSIDDTARANIKRNVQMIHGNNAFNNFFSTPAGSRF